MAEFIQSGFEVSLLKVGPHAVSEVKFGICGLPQQKVRKALLAAGANQ
jgi:hypothetical protein